jgi:PiT family inorganic phosphate transporter
MNMIILVIAVLFLAYSNGANDNFKGVATLYGASLLSYKKAMIYANIATFMGILLAIFISSGLIANFSGKGLVPTEILSTYPFVISIALGAGLTVFLATRFGMPVSTTHALVGALTGIGLMCSGTDFNWGNLFNNFFKPLIISPILALAISFLVYWGVKKILDRYANEYFPWVSKCQDVAHYISAGVVCMTHGMQDTPKIVALLLIINGLDIKISLIGLGIVMTIGCVINAKKTAQTMSKNITSINHTEGLIGNSITGFLAILATTYSLPVSFTQISVGTLFGISIVNGKRETKTIKNILWAWVLTLPLAAFFGAILYFILKNSTL